MFTARERGRALPPVSVVVARGAASVLPPLRANLVPRIVAATKEVTVLHSGTPEPAKQAPPLPTPASSARRLPPPLRTASAVEARGASAREPQLEARPRTREPRLDEERAWLAARARAEQNEERAWQEALRKAKADAEQEEEWQRLIVLAKAKQQLDEEQEWAAQLTRARTKLPQHTPAARTAAARSAPPRTAQAHETAGRTAPRHPVQARPQPSRRSLARTTSAGRAAARTASPRAGSVHGALVFWP